LHNARIVSDLDA
jgi:hypothetical protein